MRQHCPVGMTYTWQTSTTPRELQLFPSRTAIGTTDKNRGQEPYAPVSNKKFLKLKAMNYNKLATTDQSKARTKDLHTSQ